MKIMQLNAVSGISSTGRTTKELAIELQKRGHQTSVIYSEGELDYSEGYHMGNRVDKKLHALLARMTGLVGYFSRRETKMLLAYIAQWQPDIVHIRNLHGNFVNIPMLLDFLGQKKIAVVINLDDCFWFTGKCTHYSSTGCYKWENECGACPRKHQDNMSWFFDRSFRMQQDKIKLFSQIPQLALQGVSQWVAAQASQSPIARYATINYVYNWIDLTTFHPVKSCLREQLGLIHDFVVLGVASGWSDSKGLPDFIRLANAMPDIKIVLVGDMPSNVNLPNIIAIPKTHYVGELVEYYSMADVFFNPSEEETFGKVTAEAMACGTPAVVYDTTACPELIGEGCGAVVPLRNLKGAIMQIQQIKEHGKSAYQKSCIDFITRNFEMRSCVDKQLELYRKLLEVTK